MKLVLNPDLNKTVWVSIWSGEVYHCQLITLKNESQRATDQMMKNARFNRNQK